jgi:hypothetical protein
MTALILKMTASIYGIDAYSCRPPHRLMWTIPAHEQPRSIHNRNYAATREQAMADFKARWTS